MEGSRDREHHGPLGAAKLCQIHGAFNCNLGARQHDLSAAIIIGGGADADAAGFRSDRLDVGQFETDQRGHCAGADGDRFLHGTAADAQQPRRIGNGQRPGRGKRGIFAERVTGNEGRVALEIDAGFRLEDAQGRERNCHQSRLRVFGQRQRIGRPVPDDIAQPFVQGGIDFFEDPPRRRKGLSQSLAHTDGLTALTGKNKRRRHKPKTRLKT